MKGIVEPSKEFDSKLEEMRRQMWVLEVRERTALRKETAASEELKLCQQTISQLNAEKVNMESVLQQRVIQLNNYKDRAEARVNAMQRLVADWVPREQLRIATRNCQLTNEKYT